MMDKQKCQHCNHHTNIIYCDSCQSGFCSSCNCDLSKPVGEKVKCKGHRFFNSKKGRKTKEGLLSIRMAIG